MSETVNHPAHYTFGKFESSTLSRIGDWTSISGMRSSTSRAPSTKAASWKIYGRRDGILIGRLNSAKPTLAERVRLAHLRSLDEERKRQFDYFESRNPYVTRKMKSDPLGHFAWVVRHPIEAFRQRFCLPRETNVR